MSYMTIKKTLVFLITLVFLVFTVNSAVLPQINVSEFTDVKKLVNGKYSVVADGTLRVKNPSNVSKIYELSIPFDFDSLVGINKKKFDLPYHQHMDRFEFDFDEITTYMLEPKEELLVGYHIYGILDYDIYTKLLEQNTTLFNYYASYDVASNMIINLQKPQREGYIYNNETEIIDTPDNLTSRLISSNIRNPTEFSATIRDLKFYKSDTAEPMFDSGGIIKTYENISVEPFGFMEVDFFDDQSDDNTVYWVSYDVYLDYHLLQNLNRLTLEIEKKDGGGKGGGGGGGMWRGNAGSDNSSEDNIFLDSILIKKDVNKTVVRSDEEFKVILRVVNVNEMAINDLVLRDFIPENYEIKDVSDGIKITNSTNLEVSIDEVEGYGTYVLEYTLVNKDELKGITYLKPAILEYSGKEFFSDGVLVINEILPDKKLFVQKEISYVDDEFMRVTIKLKNLGNIPIKDIILSEDLDDDLIIKEISQLFDEKGLWKIRELRPGEEWELSYLTERGANVENIPNIFGVDKSSVYGTLISGGEVLMIYNEESKLFEKVGLGLAVGLLIIYLLF